MLAHQQKSKAIHLRSSSPTIKMHARRNSTGDPEFDFWGSRKTLCHESFGDHFNSGSTELEFQAEANTEDGFGVCSPPLWKTSRSKSNKQESSPLLPHNHHYSNLSPNSTRQAIADGRKELMEMIQDLPESCYELSLKDIVADQHSLQGEEESIVSKDETFDFNSETQITKLKKKKMNMNMKKGQITRTGSMESETFLIKIFLPSSLGSKKKAKASRVPSINSSEQPENDVDKVWWIKGFPIPGRRKKICRSSTNGSTSSSNSSSSNSSSSSSGGSRCVRESDFIPGCWSLFPAKKSKSMRERGCIF